MKNRTRRRTGTLVGMMHVYALNTFQSKSVDAPAAPTEALIRSASSSSERSNVPNVPTQMCTEEHHSTTRLSLFEFSRRTEAQQSEGWSCTAQLSTVELCLGGSQHHAGIQLFALHCSSGRRKNQVQISTCPQSSISAVTSLSCCSSKSPPACHFKGIYGAPRRWLGVSAECVHC